MACLKAIYHFYVQRSLRHSIRLFRDGQIASRDNSYWYKVHPDPAFLVIFCADDEYGLNRLDITSLPSSDRIWMAHIFAYRLQDDYTPSLSAYVIRFIGICFNSDSPSCLVADCLLLAGLLIGLEVDRRYLIRLDKR
jgi:hypothetical protein